MSYKAARSALRSARNFVRDEIDIHITSTCLAERHRRAGSVYGGGQFYYHPDTMDQNSKPHYRRLVRLQSNIIAGLKCLTSAKGP